MSLDNLYNKYATLVHAAREREDKMLVEVKREGQSLPPNYWEDRAILESKLRFIIAARDAFHEVLKDQTK